MSKKVATEAQALNSSTTIGTNVSKTVVGTTINLTATTFNTLFGKFNNELTVKYSNFDLLVPLLKDPFALNLRSIFFIS